MKKRMNRELFGILLFAVGFVLLIGPSYTGSVVGAGVSGVSSLSGIVLMFIGGLVFSGVIPKTYSREHDLIKDEVKRIIGEYNKDNIDAIQTAKQLNRMIRITKVNYTDKREHTIEGRFGVFSIPVKELRKAKDLVLSELILAHDNNPGAYKQSIVQFKARKGKKQKVFSSKHYVSNLEKEVNEFKEEHKNEF